MKVLMMVADNIYLAPFLGLYTKLLDQCNVEWDVIYWDKNQNEVIDDKRYIRYVLDWHNKFDKLVGYTKFRKEIVKLMDSGEYGLYIPLSPICNLLVWRRLCIRNKGRYIVDIRDYSYERFAIVRYIEKRLVQNSRLNVISSEGYKAFLPLAQYEVMHNLPKFDCTSYKQAENREKETYNISYIGLIRFMEQNKKIIDFFKNDTRFHLNFIGTNAECLDAYCKENKVNNVSLMGTFDPKETLNYYVDTDLIMNLYGNHTPLLDYALSNKLYYSAMLYKPILVCEDTYMERISGEYGFGFALPMKDAKEKEELYAYMKRLDRNQFMERSDRFIRFANQQNEQLYERLEEIFKNIEE